MKNNPPIRIFALLALLFLVVAINPSVRADNYSWATTTSSSWTVSTNWIDLTSGTNTTIPGAGDSIIAFGAGTQQIRADGTSFFVTNISDTDTLAPVSFINASSSLPTTINLSGTITMNAAGQALTFRLSGDNISVNTVDALVSSGTLNLGVSASQPMKAFSSTGTVTVNGGALNMVMPSGTATLNSLVVNSGTANVGTGTAAGVSTFSASGITAVSGGLLNFVMAGGSPSLNSLVVNSGTMNLLNSSSSGTVLATAFTVNNLTGSGGLIELNAISSASSGDTGSLTISSTGNSEYDGVIADGVTPGASSKMFLSVFKNGAFTQTLTGALAYTGTTGINAGVLQIGNGGASGSLASNTVLNTGTLAFDLSSSGTYAGNISGSGALVQLGSGTTNLTGSNTFAGTAIISNGGLQVGTGGSLGSLTSDVAIQNGATFTIARTGTIAYGGIISGSTGSFSKANSGTLILQAASTYSGTTSVLGGTPNNNITLSNANALQNSTVSVLVANGLRFDTVASTFSIGGLAGSGSFVLTDTSSNPITLQIGGNNGSSTYSGNLTGAGSLVQIGSGITILTGSNSFTGGATVSSGTLQVGAGGGAGFLSGNVAIQNNGAFTIARTGTLAYNGILSGSTGAFTKANSGTLILQAASTYSGTTTILGGTPNNNITLSNANALQNSTVSVLVANGLRFDTVASTFSIGGLAGSGDIVLTDTSSNPITLQIGSNNGSSTYSGDLTGSGAIQKLGTGILTLIGDESNAGQTIVSSGTLAVGQGGAIGTITSDVAIQNGATFAISRTGTFAYAGIISGTDGIFQKNNSATLILQAASTFSGTTQITSIGGTNNILLANPNALQNSTVNMTSTNGLRFDDAVSSSYTIGGLQAGVSGVTAYAFALTGTGGGAETLRIGNNNTSTTFAGMMTGAGGIEKIGQGNLTLSGANTYVGPTTITSGTLTIGAGGSSGAVSDSSSVVDNSHLVFNRSDAYLYGGSISGSGQVHLIGSGTAIFSGASSYTGPTTVAAGVLVATNISGSVTGNGSVDVQAGAALAGTGFLVPTGTNGVTVETNGAVAPGLGGSSGALTLDFGSTTGGLSMLNQSTFVFTLGPSNASSLLNLFNFQAGDLSLAGTVSLSLVNAQAGTFNLFELFADAGTTPYAGALDTSDLSLTGLNGFDPTLSYSGGVLSLTLATPAPEPSSVALLGIAALGVAILSRRVRAVIAIR